MTTQSPVIWIYHNLLGRPLLLQICFFQVFPTKCCLKYPHAHIFAPISGYFLGIITGCKIIASKAMPIFKT